MLENALKILKSKCSPDKDLDDLPLDIESS